MPTADVYSMNQDLQIHTSIYGMQHLQFNNKPNKAHTIIYFSLSLLNSFHFIYSKCVKHKYLSIRLWIIQLGFEIVDQQKQIQKKAGPDSNSTSWKWTKTILLTSIAKLFCNLFVKEFSPKIFKYTIYSLNLMFKYKIKNNYTMVEFCE